MLVDQAHLQEAVSEVLKNVDIESLYPNQWTLLRAIFEEENIFFTSATNSGKTIPPVLYPLVQKALVKFGYTVPQKPKVLFVTALNSLQISLIGNLKAIGINCQAVTSSNVQGLLESDTSVFLISPEVLKLLSVTKVLLNYRSDFVLKVIDEAHLGK